MKINELIVGYFNATKMYFDSLEKRKKLDQLTISAATLFEQVHSESQPCFVLSTGRSGTHFLTELLSKTPHTEVHHEPQPELVYFSKKAFEKTVPNEELLGYFEGARYEMIRDCFLTQKQYIETNNRITFFAYQIAELYPQARFLHLVRNPLSFIKSGINRRWYTNTHFHDEGRIVMKNSEDWKNMTQAQQIAWLWNETNLFIDSFKEKYPNKVITIKAEELFSNEMKYQEILTHFFEKPVSSSHFQTVKPSNQSKKNVNELNIKELTPFIPLAKKYYPELF
jgi:hypothetical protein